MEGGDEVQTLGGGHAEGLMPCFIEVLAEFHHPGAEAGDRGILVEGIVVRHVDRRGDPGARSGERDGLAMIAARR